MLERQVKSVGRLFGVEISKYRPAAVRRLARIRAEGIQTVLDVGANVGQYAHELRSSGFDGTIVSFEPQAAAFEQLAAQARRDSRWEVYRTALGRSEGQTALNVASNSASSSLLGMLPAHQAGAPTVGITGAEIVPVAALDSLELPVVPPLLLKLDVQGYEDRVLAGAGRTLSHVRLVECELSLDQLYGGQPSFRQMIDLVSDLGFEIADLETVFYDQSDGRVLSVNAMFQRAKPSLSD